MNSKWMLPLAVFGLGSMGVLMMSDRGLQAVQWMAQRLVEAPRRFQEWNEAAQSELERVQAALDRMVQSLETVQ